MRPYTFTLDTLPENGHVFAFVTGERINFTESPDEGVAERGWINPGFSRTALFDSRNDVSPVWDAPVSSLVNGYEYAPGLSDSPEDVQAELIDAIRSWVGFADSSDDGTIYAADVVTHDYTVEDVYRYAVHVFVKFADEDGRYVERPVHVPLDLING